MCGAIPPFIFILSINQNNKLHFRFTFSCTLTPRKEFGDTPLTVNCYPIQTVFMVAK